MSRLALVMLCAISLAGCGGSVQPEAKDPTSAPSTTAAAPTAAVTGCPLPNDVEYIERDVTPDLPPSAIRLGAVFLPLCKSTPDALPLTSPLGAGFCTQVALASDNPGYDENATPAAPLHKVVAQVGAGC